MATTPEHIATQAVGKHDKKHMDRTDEDRAADAKARGEAQFGEVKASPDVDRDDAGDVTLVKR